MKKKIFAGVFLTGILVFLSSIVLVLGAMAAEYNEEYQKEIRSEAYLLAHAVDISGDAYFHNLESGESHRITWIAADGKVLFDSYVDESTMANHGSRPEVVAAVQSGYGEDTRYSNTLSEKTIYCAVRLEDETILRVSQMQLTVFALMAEMIWEILLVLLIAVVLSLLMAGSLAKKIIKPLNEIDVQNPEATAVYEEVRPLVWRIVEQNNELNHQITRLKVDVDEKTKEADFRKEFTANVSHELKTPLTSISGFAELIKTGFAKDEDIPRFAGRIYEEAQRLIALVEDILKLAQLDEKEIAVEKTEQDLYILCEEVLYTLEKAAESRHIQMKLEGEHLFIKGVPQILSEMVYNLCDNAIKYNRMNGSVTVSVFKENGRPAVSVEDNGIGIPQEDLERIFERFFRVNKSHSKEIGGTGLGLSIVKHGAAYHHAQIHVDSMLNEGTKITIIF